MNPDNNRTERGNRAANVGLAALYLIAATSVAGFGIFRAWPELLNSPAANAFYPRAFALFPRVQIALAFVVLAIVLIDRVRFRWIGAFVAIYLVSLGSELLGTTVGVPFGPYEYTHLLGPKWFSHVPFLIPVSWFTMALPSYALAGWFGARARGPRIMVASLILLAWDLCLDPAMSGATTYWIWGTEGAYYGMPFLNLVGWFVTGLALMAVFAVLRADDWMDALPPRWMTAYYGANLALPLGMTLAAEMWLAAAATVLALGACVAIARWTSREPAVGTDARRVVMAR